MHKFSNFEELCIIKYNGRYVAMTKHGDLTKQVTANYVKCDGSYETLVEAVKAIVGVDLPNKTFLDAMLQPGRYSPVESVVLDRAKVETFNKI